MRLAWCVLIASAVGADALKRRAKGAAPPPTASERFVSSLKAGDLRTAFKVSPRAYADWWTALAQEAPQHVAVESVLLALIAWLLLGMKKSDSREEPLSQLSKREIEELVEEWQPEPLVPAAPDADDEPGEVIQSFDGATVTVSGSKKKLNMAGFDFLGLRSAPQPREAADAALRKYGCGSCGPRGFYGTIDVHAALETSLAKFLGVDQAIVFSDSASTLTSTVPAFAKRGDLVIVDAGVHEPLRTGITLSRANVQEFVHNDMAHLRALLEGIAADDKKRRRDPTSQRRFIIAEGLYRNWGDVVPLAELVALKNEFKFRLILDESFSFGVLGPTGRGVTEMFEIPISEVEILTVSLAHSLASIGGACVGSTEVVDHQRLSGAGYCFSASAPPFVSSAAMASLEVLGTEPQAGRLARLRSNTDRLVSALCKIHGLEVRSDRRSPIVHVGLAPNPRGETAYADAEKMLTDLARRCSDAGVCIPTTKYMPSELEHSARQARPLRPSLRCTVTAIHTAEQIDAAAKALGDAARAAGLGLASA